jgi:hypothetical protein
MTLHLQTLLPFEAELLRTTAKKYGLVYTHILDHQLIVADDLELSELQEVCVNSIGNRISVLNVFKGEKLSSIPSEWGALNHLKALHLKGNTQLAIPDTFQNLAHLMDVSFENVDLGEALDLCRHWSLMETFTAKNCGLTDFPLGHKIWRRADSVDLSMNKLSAIPEWLVTQKSMRLVDVSHNLISDLKILRNENKVRWDWLDISDNLIEDYSPIESLNRLYLLSCEQNRLNEIPLSFLKLTRLQYLYLQKNRIKSLPDSLPEFWKKLAYFDLGFNSFDEIPPLPFSLPKIQAIDLTGNHFSPEISDFLIYANCMTPDRISQAGNLEYVYQIQDQHSKIGEVREYLATRESFFDRICRKIEANTPLTPMEIHHPDLVKLSPFFENKYQGISNGTSKAIQEAVWDRSKIICNSQDLIL